MDKPRRRRRSRAQWQRLLARAARSKLSVGEFCRREDLSPASFYQWRRRLAPATAAGNASNSAGATAFVDLGTLAPSNGGVEPRDWSIELQPGGDVVPRFRRR